MQLKMRKCCVQASEVDLHEGAQKGTLTQLQMELVTCFARDRVHDGKGWVRVALQHLPVYIESSADALPTQRHMAS